MVLLIMHAAHYRFGKPVVADGTGGDVMFVPQRPYMVLGTLREQLLYPTWASASSSHSGCVLCAEANLSHFPATLGL